MWFVCLHDWPVDSCVFLSLVFLSPRSKSKLKGKHHISSSIIELTNVRFCGLIVGPCVAFLKLVMVGVVAPSTGCEMQTWANSMGSKFFHWNHNGSTLQSLLLFAKFMQFGEGTKYFFGFKSRHFFSKSRENNNILTCHKLGTKYFFLGLSHITFFQKRRENDNSFASQWIPKSSRHAFQSSFQPVHQNHSSENTKTCEHFDWTHFDCIVLQRFWFSPSLHWAFQWMIGLL